MMHGPPSHPTHFGHGRRSRSIPPSTISPKSIPMISRAGAQET
jgi:hypothetical protein